VTTGVVVMAYGTPASMDEVGAYYTHIRRGQPPTPELLADLERRYRAIGGTSPLATRSEAQRARLQSALDELAPAAYRVVLGHKHAPPFIEDAVASLAADGLRRAVGLVLAPHYSRASVGEYLARLRAAAADRNMTVATIDSWHLEPPLVDFLAGAVKEGLGALPERTKVLFTAHSLPVKAMAPDDPYEKQLRATARAVAERNGLDPWSGWATSWQSPGRTRDPWLGPDVLAVIADLGATGRADGVLVCPHGFTSDHLEVLYDLDIAAAAAANVAGLAFGRTRSVNDDPDIFAALAARVAAATPTDP